MTFGKASHSPVRWMRALKQDAQRRERREGFRGGLVRPSRWGHQQESLLHSVEPPMDPDMNQRAPRHRSMQTNAQPCTQIRACVRAQIGCAFTPCRPERARRSCVSRRVTVRVAPCFRPARHEVQIPRSSTNVVSPFRGWGRRRPWVAPPTGGSGEPMGRQTLGRLCMVFGKVLGRPWQARGSLLKLKESQRCKDKA